MRLSKTTLTELDQQVSGYDMEERAEEIWKNTEIKWAERCQKRGKILRKLAEKNDSCFNLFQGKTLN